MMKTYVRGKIQIYKERQRYVSMENRHMYIYVGILTGQQDELE